MPLLRAVDSRLFLLDGQRPSRLRKTDVPNLAKGLIAVLRKRASIGTGYRQGVGYVRIWDPGFSMIVLKEDWERIFPFIRDGSFDPLLTPVNPPVAYLNPKISFKDSVLELADQPLFQHMLALLEPLFPAEWPTSTL